MKPHYKDSIYAGVEVSASRGVSIDGAHPIRAPKRLLRAYFVAENDLVRALSALTQFSEHFSAAKKRHPGRGRQGGP